MTSGISSTAFSHVLNSARRSSSAPLFFLPIEVPFTDTVFLGKSRLATGLPNSLTSWAPPQRRTVPVRKIQRQLRYLIFWRGRAGQKEAHPLSQFVKVGVPALDNGDGLVDGVGSRHLALVKYLDSVEPGLAVVRDLRFVYDRVDHDIGILLAFVEDGVVASLLVALHGSIQRRVDLQRELVEQLGVFPAKLREKRAAELHAPAEDLIGLGAKPRLVANAKRRLPLHVRPAACLAELHDEYCAVRLQLRDLQRPHKPSARATTRDPPPPVAHAHTPATSISTNECASRTHIIL